jgi:adenylate cyclase
LVTPGADGTRRRLAAILAADVVGSSRLMAEDEAGALARLGQLRHEVLEPRIGACGGRLFKTMGDGFLAEFSSTVEALRCALDIQATLQADVGGLVLRIGVHQGDVVIAGDGADLLGDGVNVATRLERMAEPGGIVISARVQEDAAGKLAVAAEDLGEQTLKNIPRPVRVFRVRPADAGTPSPSAAASVAPGLTLPDRPSLVVLPFQNMSGDPEQEYFVDGLVEDITTAFSRIRWLLVIARNSAFVYKGRTVDVRQVGRDLGVRYVLEGGVRKAGNRVRITAELDDARTGAQLWADQFDGGLDDIFALQDRVTGRVVGAIEPQIRSAEIAHAQLKPPDSLQAYDLRLRALAKINMVGCAHLAEGIDLLRQAIGMDPGYASAHATLGRCRWRQVAQGCLGDNGPAIAEALSCMETALSLQDDDPDALAYAGFLLATVGGDRQRGVALVQKALSLNPNAILALDLGAMLRAYAGETDAVRAYVERADRLNPFEVTPGRNLAIAVAHFANGRYEDALEATGASLRDWPKYAPTLRYRVASLGLLGRIEEGRAAMRQLATLTPGFTIARARTHLEVDLNRPFPPGVIEAFCEGLSRVGVPA